MPKHATRGTRTAVALLAGAALLLTAGCGLSWGSYSDGNVYHVTVTEIVIDGGSGDVTVAPGPDGEVEVTRTVRFRGQRVDAPTHEVDNGVLHLSTRCGRNCSVSYQVRAPRGAAVRGQNGSGDIHLTDVGAVDVTVGSGSLEVHRAAGPVVLETRSGRITVVGVVGDLTARTGSGSIEVTDVQAATVDLQTSSGNIRAALDTAADVRARTSSGNVDLSVPQGSYRVDADTSSGRVTVDIPTDPAGDHHLVAETSSGNVRIQLR